MVSYLNIISEYNKDNNNDNSKNVANPTSCSICQSNQIITDSESGELICSKCGQVISDKVQQTGPEWRNFASSPSDRSNDKRSRIGMSTSLARHDMGLSTIIGRTDRDASGQKIDTAMRTKM